MDKKFYLLQYPSHWGMGSDSETRLVKDSDLRRLISIALEKKREADKRKAAGDIWYRYDGRFTGTWENEVFCDSSDIEEVMEDIIQKRLNTCSTYAGVNDLTVVPEGVPIFKEDIEMKNTIFRVCNQFGCIYDVIVGEVVFKRYIVDLREYGDLGYLKGDSCYDFVGYNMKRVLTYVIKEDRDSFIERHKDLIERMTGNRSNGNSGKYFINYLEKVESPEYPESYRKERINDSIRLIQKFKNVTATTDEYVSHFYGECSGNKYIDKDIRNYNRQEKTDHTLLVYSSPIEFSTFGQIWHNRTNDSDYFTYGELFDKGNDVEWLTSSLTQSVESPEKRGKIRPFYALVTVFAKD